MSRPMTVVTAIARRSNVRVAAGLVAEGIALGGLEYELAHHRIHVGRREPESGIVGHAPDAGHALQSSELGLEIPEDRRTIAWIEDVDVAGAVIGDEARPGVVDGA